jgi:photosystem II stability/assembly factor-like uncharacterized protein
MHQGRRTTLSSLLTLLCLVASVAATPAQWRGVGPERSRRVSTYSPTKWEKAYVGKDKAVFKVVYSAAMQPGKTNSLRWLWLGDDRGFVRLTVFDPGAQTLLGPDELSPSFFALSKLQVGGPNAAINSLLFISPEVGYVLMGNRLYGTRNAGFNWRLLYTAPDQPDQPVKSAATLFGIATTPSGRACMVGMYSQPAEVRESLVLCTDGSLDNENVRWKRVVEVPTQAQLFHIFFLDDRHGWIVGTQGTILKTADGGKTWEQTPIEAESLLQSYFLDDRNGWVVGKFGTILRTVNGGANWDPVKLTPDARVDNIHLRGIRFAPDRINGWIVGDQGTILHTGNGGDTWQLQPPPSAGNAKEPKPDLYSVFIDEDFCWAVGSNGAIWRNRLQ